MTAAVLPATDRRVPPLGGFSLTFLRLEVRRLCATAGRWSSRW